MSPGTERTPPISLIVGLGNPGPRYAETRHNAGFWFVDAQVRAQTAAWRADARFEGEVARGRFSAGAECWLLKPTTFMNRSGTAVQKLAAFYRIPPEAILVVHDDLDLPPGTARLKRGGGHGGHNGLRDLHRHLGADYVRLRIGIGHPGVRDAVLNYVLDRPPRAEFAAIDDALQRAGAVIDYVVSGDWDRAVRLLHSQPMAGKQENAS